MRKIEIDIERLGPVVSATLKSSALDPFEALIAPGDLFRHPREVLAHPGLTVAEKRAILASWASDAHALDSCPALRCLPGCRSEPVPVEAVLTALAELDAGDDASGRRPTVSSPPAKRRQLRFSNVRDAIRARRRDDDDDPPPFPAAAMPRPRPPAPPTAAVAVPA